MKGGDVIIVAALKALKSAGALAGMNLVVVMTGDEEDSGIRRPRRAPRSSTRPGARSTRSGSRTAPAIRASR